jgi:hypothetical protein
MATFVCDACRYTKTVADEWVNRRAVCPKCQHRSVIEPDDIALVESAAFDETQTFAYKGDFLGMTLNDFLTRHDDSSGEDFRFVASTDVAADEFGDYEFEQWMQRSDRLIQYTANGDRLTIVGFPLKLAVYTFLDSHLASISLSLNEQTTDIWADLLPELMLALDDETEDGAALDNIHITTWVRPLGNLNLVFIQDPMSVHLRYVNLELLDAFNRLRTSLTASGDL